MHGEHIGIAQSPQVSSAYLLVALLLAGCAKYAAPAPADSAEYPGAEGETEAAAAGR
jgi:AGZA family xanthine/uracil permease-like MFS transporter